MIAFYPVFGEVVFFYLLYQDLQKEPLPEETIEVIADSSDEEQDGKGSDVSEEVSGDIIDDPTEVG